MAESPAPSPSLLLPLHVAAYGGDGAVSSPRLAEANVTDKEEDDLLRSYIWNVKRPDTASEGARVGVIAVTEDAISVIKMKRKWDDRRDASAATAEKKE